MEVMLQMVEATTPQAAESVPKSGTFYSAQFPSWPPLPCNIKNVPVWNLGDGAFLLSDLEVDYSPPMEQTQSGMRMMGLESFDSENSLLSPSFVLPDYGTNLWIAQVGISSGSLVGIVSNSVADTYYELQSCENLLGGWSSEGAPVYGSEAANWTPFSVAMNNRTNLFVRIKSWADSTGSGIPNWWQLQYFVYVGIDPYADPDGDGYNNLEEYLNGTNPIIFNSPPKAVTNVQALNTVSGTTNVVVSWQSPSSSVTNYTIVRTSGTNVTTYTVSGNVSSWTDTNAPAGSTYQVAANYPSGSAGSSPTADPTYNPLLAIDPEIVRGPAPSSSSLTPLQIVLGGIVPTNVTAIRVHKKVSPLVYNYQNGAYDWWLVWYAGDQGWYAYFPDSIADGSFDVPIGSFTNGIYQIPVSQLSEWCAYYFQLQPIGSDGRGGVINAPVFARNVPFVDGSAVLKDNLSFILRAGETGDPNAYDPALVDFEANNNYAAVSPYVQHMDISPDWVTEVAAFNDNWFMRNWEYDGDFDYFFDSDNGNTYYFFWWNKHLDPYGGYSAGHTKYQFDGFTYVNTQSESLLNSQLTNNPPIYLGFDIPNEIGFFGSPPDQSGLFWDGSQTELASGWENYFGLTYQSVRVTQSQNPLGVQHDISAGGSYADPMPDDYSEYFQKVSAPSLTTVDYYFAESGDPTSEEAATLTPIPNDPNFSVTSTTSLIIAGVGQPAAIYGWAKQQISNSDSSKFAYLGQYFDKAYKTDGSGNATSTQTGILSEYGDFFATEPGKVILKTKADPGQGGSQGQCPVYAVSLNVDANHDGVMDLTYSGQDTTSANQPMVFWVNNDSDHTEDPANDPGHDTKYMKDCDDWGIGSQRDLEDFARLWICGVPALTNGAYQVTLSWANVSSGTPIINLFDSIETNGGIGYLTDTNVAKAQVRNYPLFNSPGWKVDTISPSHSFTFPANYFTNAGNKYFLFEGAGTNGSGQLVMTISQNGNTIAQTGVWLDMHDVKDFYERAVITNNISGAISNWTSGIEIVQPATSSALGDDTNLIVLVHGFNVGNADWLIESDTVFKRLYRAGYRGKFMTVKWPAEPITAWTLISVDTSIFNNSEIKAYKAGTALKNYLSQLRTRFPNYQLNVLAHSQGNAIMGEAIEQGAPFDTYILTQGAMPASSYDVNATTDSTLLAAEFVYGTPEWQPMGYHGVYTNLPGRIVSFYNPQDSVLNVWVADQAAGKPDGYAKNLLLASPYYTYDGINAKGWHHSILNLFYYLVTDPQESRAMISRSRTQAVGRQDTAGAINSTIDLHAQFGFTTGTPEHSAEWTRPIQTSLPYYAQILTTIKP